MIRLSGLEPGVDIAVVFTGMRPGERLTETLFSEQEPTMEIGLPGVLASTTPFPAMEAMRAVISDLSRALEQGDGGRSTGSSRRRHGARRAPAAPRSGKVLVQRPPPRREP